MRRKYLLINLVVLGLILLCNFCEAQNLIPNGGFEQGLTNWVNVSGGTSIVDEPASAGFGSGYIKIDGNLGQVRTSGSIGVTGGNRYTISFAIKVTSNPGTNYPIIAFEFFDNTMQTISNTTIPGLTYSSLWPNTWYSSVFPSQAVTDMWNIWRQEFHLPTGVAYAKVKLYNMSSTSSSFWDEVRLEEGVVSVVPNSSFEQSFSGKPLFFEFSGTVSMQTGDNGYGSNHVRVGGGGVQAWVYSRGTLSIQGGRDYYVSLLVREVPEEIANNNAFIGFRFFDNQGQQIQSGNVPGLTWSDGSSSWYEYIDNPQPTTDWSYWSHRFTAPAAADRCQLVLYSWRSAAIEFDEITLDSNPLSIIGNGSFDHLLQNGTSIALWTGAPFYYVDPYDSSGHNVVSGGNISHSFPLQPNTTYNLSIVYKTITVPQPTNTMNGALVGVHLYDANGVEITDVSSGTDKPQGITWSSGLQMWYFYLPSEYPINQWKRLSNLIRTGPTTRQAKIELQLWVSGFTYYIDAVKLIERKSEEFLNAESFENPGPGFGKEFGWEKKSGSWIQSGDSLIFPNSGNGYGDHYVRILGQGAAGYGAIGTAESIQLNENTPYTFHAMMRTDNAGTAIPALIGFEFLDSNDNRIINNNDIPTGLSYSPYIPPLWYRYVYAGEMDNTWRFVTFHFVTPRKTKSANIYIYKWSSAHQYIDVDKVSITPGIDAELIDNLGFETKKQGIPLSWTGAYTVSDLIYDGRTSIEISGGNYAVGSRAPVTGGGYYTVQFMVRERTDYNSSASALFTIDVFDATGNLLGSSCSVKNLTWSTYLGGRWYSYLDSTPVFQSYQPTTNWTEYKRVIGLPNEARFVGIRLYNQNNVTSTIFDDVQLRELDYRTQQQARLANTVLWYGAGAWPNNTYFNPDRDVVKAFYPYVGHSLPVYPQWSFDEWMYESVTFLNAVTHPQSSTGWQAFFNELFVEAATSEISWFDALNQAVVNVGGGLNDTTHKVKVIIGVPVWGPTFSPANFANAPGLGPNPFNLGANPTDSEVLEWYFRNAKYLWASNSSQYTRLELAGFYWEPEEQFLTVSHEAIKHLSDLIHAENLSFYQAPYTDKQGPDIGGVTQWRDTLGPVLYYPSLFDTIYIQPGYFYDYPNYLPSLVDTAYIWAGLNNCSIDLEWTGQTDRFVYYLTKARDYGLQARGASTMLYEVGGWLYWCATSDIVTEERGAYDNLNNYLHGR
ncbi:MAG: DUF4855 domain-containing protein [Planctomycetes bacterium]|nr:DUF4855 domain-containing protein [Planctomycetota bacterium]